ncbi:hypothetical protein BV20DRAFT_970161 [Pilatotrama ljubarskyi]|nr:hypothetical protein BV20DRAFT_970161 [Pilatotrama ljubarskyi]
MLGVQDALGGACGTGCSPSYLLSPSTLLVLGPKLDTSGSRALLRKSTYASISEVSQIPLVLWSLLPRALHTGKQPALPANGQCLLYDASRACQSL